MRLLLVLEAQKSGCQLYDFLREPVDFNSLLECCNSIKFLYVTAVTSIWILDLPSNTLKKKFSKEIVKYWGNV